VSVCRQKLPHCWSRVLSQQQLKGGGKGLPRGLVPAGPAKLSQFAPDHQGDER